MTHPSEIILFALTATRHASFLRPNEILSKVSPRIPLFAVRHPRKENKTTFENPFSLTHISFVSSLVTDLLQIKDRHNGNILIDRAGHLIHIDYGFMLTSSPGSLNFETAPFKLTIEFVEVMGGRNNAMFQYFKDLVGFGFLKLRENARRIISLVEMMLPATKMACFAKGPGTIKELEERFQLKLSRDEAIAFAENLIEQSIGNWRTDSYDTYQRYFSGIAT